MSKMQIECLWEFRFEVFTQGHDAETDEGLVFIPGHVLGTFRVISAKSTDAERKLRRENKFCKDVIIRSLGCKPAGYHMIRQPAVKTVPDALDAPIWEPRRKPRRRRFGVG